MNLSKRDQSLILILVSVVLFIAAYLGIYTSYEDKTTAVETEIEALQPRLEALQSYYDNLSAYTETINADSEEIANLLARYPNDVRPEDAVMYGVDMENELGITVNSVTSADPELVTQFQGISENEDGSSYSALTLSAYRVDITYACILTYDQLKSVVDYVNFTGNCTRVSEVSMSYDSETGGLMGAITISKYYIMGLDDAYYETDVPSMGLGTDNIFGTADTTTADTTTADTTTTDTTTTDTTTADTTAA